MANKPDGAKALSRRRLPSMTDFGSPTPAGYSVLGRGSNLKSYDRCAFERRLERPSCRAGTIPPHAEKESRFVPLKTYTTYLSYPSRVTKTGDTHGTSVPDREEVDDKRGHPGYTNQLDLFSEAAVETPAPVVNAPARFRAFSSQTATPAACVLTIWEPLPPEDAASSSSNKTGSRKHRRRRRNGSPASCDLISTRKMKYHQALQGAIDETFHRKSPRHRAGGKTLPRLPHNQRAPDRTRQPAGEGPRQYRRHPSSENSRSGKPRRHRR